MPYILAIVVVAVAVVFGIFTGVWGDILPGFAVVAVAGAAMLALNVRIIERYD